MTPTDPQATRARFEQVVARALAKPLDECPVGWPARPCDKVHKGEDQK